MIPVRSMVFHVGSYQRPIVYFRLDPSLNSCSVCIDHLPNVFSQIISADLCVLRAKATTSLALAEYSSTRIVMGILLLAHWRPSERYISAGNSE